MTRGGIHQVDPPRIASHPHSCLGVGTKRTLTGAARSQKLTHLLSYQQAWSRPTYNLHIHYYLRLVSLLPTLLLS